MNCSPVDQPSALPLVWCVLGGWGLTSLGCDPHARLIPDPEPRPACDGSGHTDVPVGPCDLYRQDCARNEACVAVSLGTDFTTSCEPLFGGGGIGAPCAGLTDCDTSLLCINQRCSPICCPATDDPCAPSGACVVEQVLGDYRAMRCLFAEACELAADTCNDGFACYSSPLLDEPRCLEAGTGTHDEPCAAPNDCAPGLGCFSFAMGPDRCLPTCILGATPNPCSDGGSCQSFAGLPANVGACVP